MGLGGKAAGTTTTKKVFCLFVCFFQGGRQEKSGPIGSIFK